MIRLIQVKNPLQPSVDRESRELEYCPEARLANYLPNAGAGLTVSLNGRIVPASLLDLTTPRDGDCIVTVPQVTGGGLLRTLAQVAVLAASVAVAAVTAGAGIALLGLSTAVTSSVLAGAVGIAGNLLISAFLNTPSKKADSPTYAFDGPHSLAQSGTVIPKGYGNFLWGGNIISSFVDVEGPDQYINILACFGFGPARSIAQIQINGKPIGEYGNVQVYTRLGSNDQTPIGNFNRIVNGYPQNTQCLAAVPVVVPGTGTETQILQVDVVFPSGVWVLTNDNNLIPATITYKVEYAVAGSGAWQSPLYPEDTTDVVTYALDGNPNPYPTWVAVATDLPPNSGVVYATSSGAHYPGEPFSSTETVEIINPDGSTGTTSKTCVGEWQLTDPAMNQVQVSSWREGYVSMTGCNQSPLYQRTSIYGLAAGKYDVRVTKYGSARWGGDTINPGDNWSPQIGQDMWMHSVNEVALLDLAYPNMILIGVRGIATGQLPGSNINITAVIQHGLRTLDNNILPGALQAFEEDNPACVAADMMLDPLYGGGQWPGITAANINRFIDEWVAWAELNDELVDDGNGGSIRRHVFSGVFDNEGNLWDQVNAVGRMSRAQLIPLGRDYGVFVDQPDVPCQIFSVGNIVQDSFTETWIELDARANQVELQFADATRYYKQDNPLVYMDPANQDAGVTIKNVRVDGKGITSPAQAWHLARFKERCNQFLLRSGSFKCDVAAIASRPGNVIILQHDVPQWGWGGRTVPGSTASKVYLDRDDIPFAGGTDYNIIVNFPVIQRYAGTVTAAAPVIDATGATTGTQLSLSSFDNANRVTRAVMVAAGIEYDCPILSTGVGLIVVQPIPGYAAAPGQSYTLYDTDVMEIATVTAVAQNENGSTLTLGTPFSQAPADYSTYFYGPVGTQKLARIVNIRKASEFRATIEWIDYDARVYVDATPVIGETSAQRASKPGVTSLSGSETFSRVAGSYVSSVSLAWKNGPDTMGVGIYATYLSAVPVTVSGSTTNASTSVTVGSTAGMTVGNAVFGAGIPPGAAIAAVVSGTVLTLTAAAGATASGVSLTVDVGKPAGAPQMIARLTNQETRYQVQVAPGTIVKYSVVGFDINNDYAGFNSAPSVTLQFYGIATNLLLGSSFGSGFTYWNVQPRAGDVLAADLANDGEATYTVAGSTLTTPQVLLYQNVAPSKWAIGSYLMLSAYFQDSAVSTPNVGNLVASIAFLDASNTLISQVEAPAAMNGVTPLLNRFNTASTVVPALTASVIVRIVVSGAGLSIPVGSVLTFSHLLLEASTPTQTVPSAWAEIDVQGHVSDVFQLGSSTALRVQGSVLPSFTGTFSIAFTDTTLTISWTSLVIFWPDSGVTYITDGSMAFTGLTASTLYFAFLYWDIVQGAMVAAVPSTPIGTPAMLSAAYDAVADAACKQDGRVALTPGGIKATTAASGGSGSGSGGGSGGGTGYSGDSGPGYHPIDPIVDVGP